MDATIGVETTTCAKSSWKALLLTSFSRRRGVGFDGSRVRAIEGVLSSPSKSGGTHRETVDVSACPTFGGSASDCEESRDGPSNVAKGRA